MQTGKNLITNVIKSLPSLLTVYHTDSDVGHLKYLIFQPQPVEKIKNLMKICILALH